MEHRFAAKLTNTEEAERPLGCGLVPISLRGSKVSGFTKNQVVGVSGRVNDAHDEICRRVLLYLLVFYVTLRSLRS